MGMDAKTIQDFVRRLVRVSMDNCNGYVEKHPFVFGVVLSFFLLYFLIPSVFYFLIYTSPVIFCIIVSIKIYSRTQSCKLQQNIRRIDEKSFVEPKALEADDHVFSRNGDKPMIQSRRRHFKDKSKEWNAEGGKEEKCRGLTATPTIDALMVENQKPVTEEKESSSQNASTVEKIQARDDLMNEICSNEEKSKGVMEEKESSSLDHGESSSRNAYSGGDVQELDQHHPVLYSQPSMIDLMHDDLVEQSENNGIGGGEVEEESSDDAEDEEEAQQDRNKAVEWTADDQQNLMNLGDSELERNKRLESLIARRRARKLFRMAVEKRIMDSGSGSQGPIAPISILRNTLLNVPNSNDDLEGLHTPGSAPSVLLPSRNPFDIPYDPLEEKPNLMADSFQQEFSAAHQKDLLFPRHEGLPWGPPFTSESLQDQHDSKSGPHGTEKRTEEGHRFSRFRTFSDMSAHEQLIDNYLCQGQALFRMLSATDLVEVGSQASKPSKNSDELKNQEDREPGNGMAGTKEEVENFHDVESTSADRSEVQRDSDSVRDNSSELCSMASDEASELSFQGNISANTEILEPKAGKFPQKLSDRVQNSLTFLVPDSMAYNGASYDSSPSAIDKPRIENRFFFREKMPCHSPVYSIASDLQVEVSEIGSPPLPIDGNISPADAESSYDGDVEKEMTSGSEEMWGASSHLSGVEENESRSREVNEIKEDDIVEVGFSAIKQNLQDAIPEEVAEQDTSRTSTLSSSRNEMPEKDQAYSKNLNGKVSENVKQVAEEVQRSSKHSDALPPKIPQKHLPSTKESVPNQPYEVYSAKPEEVSSRHGKSAAAVNVIYNANDQLVHAKNAQIFTKNVASMDLAQRAGIITSESSKYIENNGDKPAEHQTVMESENKLEENKNPTFIERDPEKLNEPEDIGDMLKTTEGRDNLQSDQDNKVDQNITEVGVAGVNQSSDNPIMPVLQPVTFVAEQMSASSSSCSSPRSVLPGKIPKEPSSHFDRQLQFNVQQPIGDAIVRSNSVGEEEPESFTLTAPEDSQHLILNPLNHPSTSSSSGKSEEPSIELVEGKPEPLISPVAATVLSEHAYETPPGSIEHDIEVKSHTLPESSAGISPSKPEENTADLNFPRTMVVEEETPNSSGKSSTQANNITDPAFYKKEHKEKFKCVEGSENEVQLQKGKLTENEAVVDPSNSIERNEGSSVIKGSEDVIHLPKQASSVGNLEAVQGNQGESKILMECEASTKPSIAAAETAVPEAPSDTLLQKSTEKVDNTDQLIDSVANEMSNKKILIDQENVSDQPKPSKAPAQVDIMQIAVETVANETGNMKSLIDQEHVAEQPKPVNSPTEVDVMHNMSETVTTEISCKKSLIDQENDADQPKSGMATAGFGITFNVNESLANETSDRKSLVNQGNAADQPMSGKPTAGVDVMHNVNETIADETSNKKSLIDQETVADQPKPGNANDSLKAIEVIKHKPTESEVETPKKETNPEV